MPRWSPPADPQIETPQPQPEIALVAKRDLTAVIEEAAHRESVPPYLIAAVARVRAGGGPVGVFQCTTAYPCPPEKIGLNLVAEFRDRYLSNPDDPDAFEGPAVVFDGPEDYHARIDDPSLGIDETTDVLDIRVMDDLSWEVWSEEDLRRKVDDLEPIGKPAIAPNPAPAPTGSPRCEYFEIRPCLEYEDVLLSFDDYDEFDAAMGTAAASRKSFRVFWTLYAMLRDPAPKGTPAPGFHAQAIGDFASREAAFAMMDAINAPLAHIHELLSDYGNGDADRGAVSKARDIAEDFLNQCTNSERV